MRNGREVNLLRPIRRGCRAFALLWVLGLLVLIVPLLALSAQTAMQIHIATRTDPDISMAHDFLLASEESILTWLQTEADHVVLPLDVRTSGATFGRNVLVPLVLDDTLMIPHDAEHRPSSEADQSPRAVRIRIIAFDQCAMVPFPLSHTSLTDFNLRALQESLPAPIQERIDEMMAKAPYGSPGLDWFLVDAHGSLTDTNSGPADIFPVPVSDDITELARQDGSAERLVEISGTVGAYVSPRLFPEMPIAVNVNTASPELLEAIFSAWVRGGLEQIIENRHNGEFIATAPPVSNPDGDTESLTRLVTSSEAWAFRIDVTVSTVERSWWATYVRQVDSLSHPWKCVQRLAITD